jgi:hypothetical protein
MGDTMPQWLIILLASTAITIIISLVAVIYNSITSKLKKHGDMFKEIENKLEQQDKSMVIVKILAAKDVGDIKTLIEQKFTMMIETFGTLKKEFDDKYMTKEFCNLILEQIKLKHTEK